MEAKFARVNMIDFLSEEALAEVQNCYVNIRERPNLGLNSLCGSVPVHNL